jgi:hypothetical protein
MNAPLRRRDRPCPKKCEPLQEVTVALDEGKPVDLPTEENHLALYCRHRVQNKESNQTSGGRSTREATWTFHSIESTLGPLNRRRARCERKRCRPLQFRFFTVSLENSFFARYLEI